MPVFATRVEYASEPFLYSILYPIIGLPPVFAGAVQERLICEMLTAVAVNPVGEEGNENDELLVGVADASGEALLVPIEFIAYTLYV